MSSIRRLRVVALPLVLVVALCQSVLAQTVAVTRGPYLQIGTPTSITVRWRTDVQTDSCVRYGSSVSSLTDQTCETTLTIEHAVQLSSLVYNTKYYYSIGTSEGALAGGDSTYFFFTSPKTVEHHVSHILGKLGVSSRREAVRAAAGLRLTTG